MEVRVSLVNVLETADALYMLGPTVMDPVEDALGRGGKWVTYEARDRLRGQITGTYLPHYPRSITSETERAPGRVSMIVGPETGKKQGAFGPGVELGSVHTQPHPHLFDAFEARVESILDRAGRNINRWPQ